MNKPAMSNYYKVTDACPVLIPVNKPGIAYFEVYNNANDIT